MISFAATALPQVIPQSSDYVRILPELVLAIFGMAVMALDPLLGDRATQKTLGAVGLLGTLAALGATAYMAQAPGLAFWDMIRVDTFSVFFHFVVITVAAITILTSHEYMAVQQLRAGEYYALILFGTLGMALMSSAVELVLIFIALEISSIATYILAGFRRRFAISGESSLWPGRGAGVPGDGIDVRRPGLQSRGRALSCVDPRRLRGRADTHCRAHVDRPQSCGICGAAADCV